MPFPTALRGVLLTTPWLLHLLLADLLLSALLPISTILPTFTYSACSYIAYTVWFVIQHIFTSVNGAHIIVSGDLLPPGESAIVIANHVSWTDFYMIQALAMRSGMLGRCRWFAKQQLKWVPFLGWGLYAMGMPLVSRNWVKDRKELDSIFGKIRTNQWPIWLISYSEATRYTEKKYAQAVKWCEASGKPTPQHVLYPRTRGFIAQVSELRRSKHVKAVYDCTIGYAEGSKFMMAPSMWQTLSTPHLSLDYQFHVHVDRYPLDELPQHEQELAQWLENRWIAKGDRLEKWRLELAESGRLSENA